MSIRTVFRHYGTRDHMIATALRTQLLHYGDTLPVPEPGATLETWLPELLCEVHRVNAVHGPRLLGDGGARDTLTGEIGDVAAERLAGRTRFVATVSRGAWRLAGNRSRPPAWLVDLFAIHLSAFTTRELVSDFGRSVEEVAAMSARVLISAVRSATSECGRVTPVRSAP